ncbi:hypothetical protein B0T26DRAFT_297018 [Lasiosphaeria miniovina]|uniref:Uncharacterized protein n=1 Tax=Lasiosphaeria miniovina TaxID=1954250 RepID=A0AA40AKD6_9PEZI|nr:uncharacterized protein B0T26DRAFT_297018 [Lasiosphaeria miniovina]KAK0717448.1 hypothetical protein B0T26DRAFT_297018 [Lasiosphaeria miniovina]
MKLENTPRVGTFVRAGSCWEVNPASETLSHTSTSSSALARGTNGLTSKAANACFRASGFSPSTLPNRTWRYGRVALQGEIRALVLRDCRRQGIEAEQFEPQRGQQDGHVAGDFLTGLFGEIVVVLIGGTDSVQPRAGHGSRTASYTAKASPDVAIGSQSVSRLGTAYPVRPTSFLRATSWCKKSGLMLGTLSTLHSSSHSQHCWPSKCRRGV